MAETQKDQDSKNSEQSDTTKSERVDLPETVTPTAPPVPRSSSEYVAEVNKWLWQCYYWQSLAAGFPYYMQNLQLGSYRNTPPNASRSTASDGLLWRGAGRRQGTEYVVPQLWKRFAAEFIDFIILFLLKLIVTFIAVDFFEIIDLEKYDFDVLREDILDYKLALEMTSEIIMLEVIHRFVVCFFEAMCLHRGTVGLGGATPGKSILNLKVVACHTIQDLGNNRVLVHPASDIGFFWALLRSFVKNFSMAFFFPICFTLFMFQYNRTAYDILCSCIVVEECPATRH